ncbi:MAG: YciI family protein [Rhodovibrionaceae bacterium]
MLFHFTCVDRPGALQVRLDTRPDHLAYLEGINDRIVFAGPRFAADGQTPNGSVLIVDFENPAEAEAFAAADPYAKAGLFESVAIAPVKQVFPK